MWGVIFHAGNWWMECLVNVTLSLKIVQGAFNRKKSDSPNWEKDTQLFIEEAIFFLWIINRTWRPFPLKGVHKCISRAYFLVVTAILVNIHITPIKL